VSAFANDAGYLTTYTETQKLSDVAAVGDSVNTQIKNLSDPTDSMDAVNLRTLNALINQYDSLINQLRNVIDSLRNPILPTITTAMASRIIDTAATCGGNITSDGGATVTVRGICWSTSPNPTLNDNHTSDSIGRGTFSSRITGLTANTTYYVRAYATNVVGTIYGDEISFTTNNVPFSVSDSNKIVFAPGNLQWSATGTHTTADGTATGTWRFAANQWDTIGIDNANIDSNYTGWIDLFGWGTSGYDNKYPYMTSTTSSDYGNGKNDILGTNYDWGVYNAIYNPQTNTTDVPGSWRTITKDEWDYLINTRTTTSGIRYAQASVNGVNGLIIVPDNWSTSIYTLNSTNTTNANYTTNTITAADWTNMEQAGCIFLPAAGRRDGTSVLNVGSYGYSWSGTYSSSSGAYYLYFNSSNLGLSSGISRYYGRSVRLVRSAETNPSSSIALPVIVTNDISNITDSSADCGGNASDDGGDIIIVRGVCWSISPNPTINDNHTKDGSSTGSFTSSITGLTAGTTYYVRAYATNSKGTAYGNEITFTTNPILPSLTTIVASNITATSADCGGNISNDGGATVTARGICWSTSPNPTISDNHTSDGSGIGSFTSNIIGLTQGITYYVRAYATNIVGTAYGNEISFTASNTIENNSFSISSGYKIVLAPGNLQWSATGTHATAEGTAAGTWRFAANQWDTIGTDNANIDSNYTGWIDLFGWGTSGYDNKYPYMTSTTETDYGNGKNDILGTNYDWGVYNAIYNPHTNTTDEPGTWRILTKDEWYYLMKTRSTSSGIRYAKASVNGVNGLIIVPDNWSTSIYTLNSTNTTKANYTTNTITAADWTNMEQAGCIFLPAAGRRGTSVNFVGSEGYYWAGTYNNSGYAYNLNFNSSYLDPSNHSSYRNLGFSVRLVRSADSASNQVFTIPTISTTAVSNIDTTSATSGGNITSDGGATVTARGICWSTSPNPTISDSHTTDGNGIGSFTSSITGLTANTTYYVRAYATNVVGTVYGNEITFTTAGVMVNSAFSVSATDSVYFSPGNLQWSATNGGSTATTHAVAGGGTAAGTWRFAHNQCYSIGKDNANIDSNYTGWIDLFGWGTSGYNNKYPYMTSTTGTDYGYNYYANFNNNISGTNYDWGLYNAIYNPQTNTTDAQGTWRTLTKDEWVYLMDTRSTSSGVRYTKAKVMGTNGVIIVPDNWSTSIYTLNSTNTTNANYTTNTITAADWTNMEQAGCIFLPAAGDRDGTSVYSVGSYGFYWSTTYWSSSGAYDLFFSSSNFDPSYYLNRGYGISVRLVRNVQ
ncbi:MAG: hypothetical protein J5606_09725, partial [Bacteroidales bacterium]|nr:hypothetical protein [Bacteroidales bacterium]